jgi:hypothetical protein
MFGIPSFEVFFDFEVGIIPEASQVTCDLDEFEAW